MSDRPTMPPSDGNSPAPLHLGELRALFADWHIVQGPSGTLTATRKRGVQTRVIGADSPAELAAALLQIESEDNE